MVIWSKRPLPQVELRHSELVFVGYGIVAPEYAWNDYADIDVRGKTVLVLINDPGYATKDPKIFKGGTHDGITGAGSTRSKRLPGRARPACC